MNDPRNITLSGVPEGYDARAVLNEVERGGAVCHVARDDKRMAAMQSALLSYEKKLKEWFDVHTESMFLRGEGRKLQFQQWQDLLKQGSGSKPGTKGYSPGNEVGTWEIYQDSEITGDERCRDKHACKLSFPVCKLAFIILVFICVMVFAAMVVTMGFIDCVDLPIFVIMSNTMDGPNAFHRCQD